METKTLEKINKAAMEQYEQVRQSGVTNMLDIGGVMVAAESEGFIDLLRVALDRDTYILLLENFQGLMRHYGIEQE